MNAKTERDWSRFFKSSFYQVVWTGLRIDLQKTQEEVEGVLELMKPPAGSHILDWCGGWGRHSIEFARRGYRVTLLDFAPNHIRQARRTAKAEGVRLTTVLADFRRTPMRIQADYAVNMFTAGLGYLSEEDDVAALASLHQAMRPHSKLLVDTMNLPWLIKNYISVADETSKDGNMRLVARRKFDHLTNRNKEEMILLRSDGTWESHKLDHRIYSAAELTRLLAQAGFRVTEVYGGFDGRPFDFDSRRMIVISEKVNG